MKKPREKNDAIHPALKMYSGFAPETPNDEVREYWEVQFAQKIEKPCGLLLWCPYGPLVEDFPLHGLAPEGAREPITEPQSCRVFGHDCPAFYVSEPFMDPEAVAENCLCDACRAELEAKAADAKKA
ncbi:MAG: hypothetical protein EG825_17140 [Rhodocyclaceae bacterium]|nr:hypothetical protein [Rhodocyclaceae bacterium]